MNQQEINRLFEKHSLPDAEYSPDKVMFIGGFTAAINEATAQARREALDEAANLCEQDGRWWADNGFSMEAGEAAKLASAIRALAAQPQERKV
jgi:hypothetical protein